MLTGEDSGKGTDTALYLKTNSGTGTFMLMYLINIIIIIYLG
jgi:hypothetical protein